MRLTLAVVTLAILTLGATRAARADSFALLAPSGPSDLDATTRATVIDTLAAALRDRGHGPTLPAEVAHQLAAARSPECASLECAHSVVTALHVDAVLEVVLWSNGQGGVREVVVSIAWANGSETSGTSGTATLGAGALPTGARAALTQALDTGHAVAAARVVVSASPRGAALTLDGRPLGQAPWEGLLPAGHHVLVAGHVGFLVERRELELGTARVELTLTLARDPDAATASLSDGAGEGAQGEHGARVGDGQPTARGRAILGPVLLGAVGLALLGVDVGAIVFANAEPPHGFERGLSPLPVALYGAAGIGALTGALLWWLLSGGSSSDDRAATPLRFALDVGRATLFLTF